jgi:predicted nucleic acid-binding Zn ribbon protein
MPTYVYRVIASKTAGVRAEQERTFEVVQSMSDPPLTRHPETGEPVERVICPPNIATGKLGNASLASAGFTKYTKTSDGTYEKQAGAGPKRLDPRKM